MMQTLKNLLGIILELILRAEKTFRGKVVGFLSRLGLDGIVEKIVSKVFLWFGIGSDIFYKRRDCLTVGSITLGRDY